MTAVARVLPRDWDGRRLLRFLTGLAMLALAFTVHVTPPAPGVPAAPVPAAAPVAAVASSPSPTVPASDMVTAERPVLAPAETPLVVGSAVLPVRVVGHALRVRAERAPPVA